jgi:hypothetical protein
MNNQYFDWQYADDALLFLEKDESGSINLKWILTCFERILV